MSEGYKYPGEELALFEKAINWKKYFSSGMVPFIKGDVLEAGAGIGANTTLLNNSSSKSWMLLEPDESMASLLKNKIMANQLPQNCSVITGTLDDLSDAQFDTIIYTDVLEHIEKDKEELMKAASLLRSGGHIIILAPAFQFLFSPFDKSVGHYRRYSKKGLKKITPSSFSISRIRYLDSMGFFASLANQMFLRQTCPKPGQVYLWDKWMVPLSRVTDKLFLHLYGKSILAILKKDT